MQTKGRFIVIEGLEGSGKSTAIEIIKQFLAPQVPELITTREPGGTQVGEMIRNIVKQRLDGEDLDSRAELLLFYAARVQLLQHVVIPAIERGCWVIADRFELSSLAYQGGGRKLDLGMIQHLSAFCLHDIKPDLTIFLDVKPELGLKRTQQRGAADRIEQEPLAFFNDVYTSYHHHIKNMEHVAVIDASQSLAEVQQSIVHALESYL